MGDTKQKDRMKAFWILSDFEGFEIATTTALLQALGILRWRKQEERKPHNQDLKAAVPAWMIRFGHLESSSGALPGFVF